MDSKDTKMADDVIWGAEAIAAEIGVERRRAFYLLDRKLIPGRKIGATWTSSREALKRHFAAMV